jgi:hypothetical protein
MPHNPLHAKTIIQPLYAVATLADVDALAPHLGHVSNFRHPVSPLIEPMVARCFESDPWELLARVHDTHPVWTRLELAKGAQVDFRMGKIRRRAQAPPRVGLVFDREITLSWIDKLD